MKLKIFNKKQKQEVEALVNNEISIIKILIDKAKLNKESSMNYRGVLRVETLAYLTDSGYTYEISKNKKTISLLIKL